MLFSFHTDDVCVITHCSIICPSGEAKIMFYRGPECAYDIAVSFIFILHVVNHNPQIFRALKKTHLLQVLFLPT